MRAQELVSGGVRLREAAERGEREHALGGAFLGEDALGVKGGVRVEQRERPGRFAPAQGRYRRRGSGVPP